MEGSDNLLSSVCFTSRKEPPIPTPHEAWWAPYSLWMFWRKRRRRNVLVRLRNLSINPQKFNLYSLQQQL
jgi:hypothetical protein